MSGNNITCYIINLVKAVKFYPKTQKQVWKSKSSEELKQILLNVWNSLRNIILIKLHNIYLRLLMRLFVFFKAKGCHAKYVEMFNWIIFWRYLCLTAFLYMCVRLHSMYSILTFSSWKLEAVTLICFISINPAGGTALPSLYRRKMLLFSLTARSKWRDHFLEVTNQWWTTRASLFLVLVCWITRFSRSVVIDCTDLIDWFDFVSI